MLPYRFIRSNFQTLMYNTKVPFADWFARVQHGPGLVGLGIPLAWVKRLRTIVVASSHTETFQEGWGSHADLETSIRAFGISVDHEGFDASRQQKTSEILRAVRAGEVSPPALKVCLRPQFAFANCGNCSKCRRTISAILIEGEDPTRFGFDGDLQKIVDQIQRWISRSDMPMPGNARFFWCDVRDHARKYHGEGRYKNMPQVYRDFAEAIITMDIEARAEAYVASRAWRERVKALLKPFPALVRWIIEFEQRVR